LRSRSPSVGGSHGPGSIHSFGTVARRRRSSVAAGSSPSSRSGSSSKTRTRSVRGHGGAGPGRAAGRGRGGGCTCIAASTGELRSSRRARERPRCLAPWSPGRAASCLGDDTHGPVLGPSTAGGAAPGARGPLRPSGHTARCHARDAGRRPARHGGRARIHLPRRSHVPGSTPLRPDGARGRRARPDLRRRHGPRQIVEYPRDPSATPIAKAMARDPALVRRAVFSRCRRAPSPPPCPAPAWRASRPTAARSGS
jgi:hypothetical protein